MRLKLVYFAWVRERIGVPNEELELAASTPLEVIEALRARDQKYAQAFEDLDALRFAIDAELCEPDTPLDGARELAIFPPMTGG